ncbi:MAG: phenylalanine--tRNA ligase subunit alpha [Deltaproteobacteria bacterium]|nr:phenylalanine--tRNA ligase subunit alpha [Deltaproteobacteria bacterium]
MSNDLQTLREKARGEIANAPNHDELDKLRVKYLGKTGEVSLMVREIGKKLPEERKAFGAQLNELKAELEGALEKQLEALKKKKLEAELAGPGIDVTMPGRRQPLGTRHPVSRTLEEITDTFLRMGFEIAQGPEIELDYYNFESLNFPPDHPARDMQDTFIVDAATVGGSLAPGSVLLRTHTSPVQVRAMLAQKPPVRVICPGKVYRCDSDLTHTPMFHQVEGLLVDEKVTFGELKGTLAAFAKAFFGDDVKTRFRPSFFPFTEPSAEVDVSCFLCGGKGCRVCKQTGWLEVLGAGMVHPNVFKSVGYQSDDVTGFAFGMGVERLAMLRYGIDDLRTMFENDARFLAQL